MQMRDVTRSLIDSGKSPAANQISCNITFSAFEVMMKKGLFEDVSKVQSTRNLQSLTHFIYDLSTVIVNIAHFFART